MKLTLHEALKKGIEAHRTEQYQEAEKFYAAILQAQPKHSDANHNMGVLAVDFGKVQESLPFFETALANNPDIAQFWCSYIDALIRLNRRSDAKKVIDQAEDQGVTSDNYDQIKKKIEYQSNNSACTQEDANFSLLPKITTLSSISLDQSSNLIKQKQKTDLSVDEDINLQRSIELLQDNKKIFDQINFSSGDISTNQEPQQELLQSMMGFYEKRQFQQVLIQAKKLLTVFPNSIALHLLIGAANSELAQYDAALESYENVLEIEPDCADAHYNIGIALHEKGDLDAAIESYNKALGLKPDYAGAHYNLGNTLMNKGNPEAAIDSYKQALEIEPEHADAYNNLGNALQYMGNIEAAIDSYKQALRIRPDYAAVHHQLSLIKKLDGRDEHFRQMKFIYNNQNITNEQRCHLCFALSSSAEYLGYIDQSFKYLKEGNEIRKNLLGYNINQDIKFFADIKNSHQNVAMSTLQAPTTRNTPIPIFILGMPRSGTTLVEQIVSAHPEVTGAGELPYVDLLSADIARGTIEATRDNLSIFRKEYLGKLKIHANGAPFVTDKMPQNFRYIGLICAAIPEAIIIHVKRDPIATCWSNYTHYFAATGLGYCYNIDDIIKYYEIYKDLMHLWHEQYQERIYHLDYEKLIGNQEKEIRRIIQYIGLDWEDACLSPQDNKRRARTASQQQVRQKIYQGSSQNWLKFQPFLDGSFDQLADTD